MYTTMTPNSTGICASRPRNAYYRSVFPVNGHFSTKSKANFFIYNPVTYTPSWNTALRTRNIDFRPVFTTNMFFW
jgi:hypothetical protein